MESTPIRRSRVDLVFGLLIAAISLAGSIWCTRPEFFPTAAEATRNSLLQALQDRRQDLVGYVERARAANAHDLGVIFLAGEAASQLGEYAEAVKLYQQLPLDGGLWEFQRELALARRYYILGRLGETEQSLRRALTLNPVDLEANERLGHLLQVCGRAWDSAPYFFTQIQRGKCRGDELLGMAATDRFFRYDERLERMGEAADPLAMPIRLAAARRAIFENREQEAETILRTLLASYPQIGEAQGRMGRIIVERGDITEFLQWRGAIPEEGREHPEVLFVEGLQARRLGLIEGAVHCFSKTLRLSPNHTGANLQMAACLDQLGQSDIARHFAQRAELMSNLEQNYNLLRSQIDEPMIFKSMDILDTLGRDWEAAAWCLLLTRLNQPPQRARDELNRRLRKICHIATPNDPDKLPLRLLRSESYPSPRWPVPVERPRSSSALDDKSSTIQFEDTAVQSGIDFQYFEGTDEATRLTHIINVMGGGVGAIDFDQDGWIDLYLAQANNWRNASEQPEYSDRLFRNALGKSFADVTTSAGLNELKFSHGVTVGDYDQDGFPDIYVGNLGPNTLFHNNGDGTFSDVTEPTGVGGDDWTTSSAFADFNADGFPDLYVSNYTLLKETKERECPLSSGEPKACTPDLLPAAHDRLYLNLGNGSFRDVSAAAGILVPDGKGLGVVAWDFNGDGRLDLFVANDTTPNFLFLNQGSTADGVPMFTEEGIVRGVAFDQDGNAQASMGVAAGDANGDGRLDLFITNFFGDSNTLYIAQEKGFFADLTRPYGLRDPSFWMLGFGCQFADFDGDRWEDLVATNGHVDQRSSTGSGDRMPPQVYKNARGHHFDEVPATELGPFFQGKYLGRGLAILDWNRDGKTDIAISHLHSRFALLNNQTVSRSSPLVVRLIGTRGQREAIGATVIARYGEEITHRMMTTGDGFLASNERRLHFGCPGVRRLDEITIRWPDGHSQNWKNLKVNQEIVLIEDRAVPIVLYDWSESGPQELH